MKLDSCFYLYCMREESSSNGRSFLGPYSIFEIIRPTSPNVDIRVVNTPTSTRATTCGHQGR